MDTYEIIGNIAAVMAIAGYFLLTTKRLTSHSKIFQWLNLLSSILLIIYGVHKQAPAVITINVVWGSIAIAGLVWHKKHKRLYKTERRQRVATTPNRVLAKSLAK